MDERDKLTVLKMTVIALAASLAYFLFGIVYTARETSRLERRIQHLEQQLPQGVTK